MEYPLELSFKILSVGQRVSVTNARGELVFYVKQKLFTLKEEVTVFADVQRTRPLYEIDADRVIDFSARYDFTDINGINLGSVKREGMRSLWKAHYNISDGDAHVMTIREENPWVKALDGMLSEVPIIGMITGYILHPAYLVSRTDGTAVMRLEKQPSFLEGRFTISRLGELDEREETRVLLSLLLMILLERARG